MARQVFTVRTRLSDSSVSSSRELTNAIISDGLDIDVEVEDVTFSASGSTGFGEARVLSKGTVPITPNTLQITTKHFLTRDNREWKIVNLVQTDFHVVMVLEETTGDR